ncbi:MAG: hypothetical protein Q9160_007486 [Pyrenula sp. 1 TL-2023]
MGKPKTLTEKAALEEEISSQDSPRATDASSVEKASETLHDPSAEKKLLRKIDLRLIPILSLLYLCAFVDRINIGNARIQGLEKDLNMHGHDYNIALLVFFPTYILLEIPSNILLKKIRPSIWLSFVMFSWGVITICQGLTKSFAGLCVCRVLLGVFEAGFVPGATYLITMYYKRYETQWRFNLFFSASILAGAFSGLLAYAIAHMDGLATYSGWRWIFILEGLFTCAVAAISPFLIPDWPETTKFLSPPERTLLLSRLHADPGHATMNTLSRRAVRRILTDPKIYLGILIYMGIVNTGYATSFFTPTILKQLHWTSIHAQVMSIPIYIVATTCALTVALLTDRVVHARFPFAIAGCVIASIGYAILLNMHSVPVGARYFALYLVTSGGYICQPVTIIWLSNNVGGHYKRAVAAAAQIGIGNVGGIIASNIFFDKEAPEYRTGLGVSLGLVWVCGVACLGMLGWCWRENRMRERGERDRWVEGLSEEEKRNMGDDWPGFKFTY